MCVGSGKGSTTLLFSPSDESDVPVIIEGIDLGLVWEKSMGAFKDSGLLLVLLMDLGNETGGMGGRFGGKTENSLG